MPNQENLIPVTQRCQEDAKRISSLGGIAKAKKKKEEKTLREKYEFALNILNKKVYDNVKDKEFKKILEETDLLVFEQLKIILQDGVKKETKLKAIENIQDRIYGKPKQSTDITSGGKEIKNLTPPIINVYSTPPPKQEENGNNS